MLRGAPARGHVEHVAAAALLLAAGRARLHGLDRGEALADVSRGEGEASGSGEGQLTLSLTRTLSLTLTLTLSLSLTW